MHQSLDSWLKYLNSLHPKTIDLGLDRLQPIAEDLGLTEFSCPVITVGGTNGKGSCVRFLESTYLKAGYKVAAYTSPHLVHFNERLRINEAVLADSLWLDAFARIEEARADTSLSFFEFTTLAALWLCQQQELELIILEVGLGGRLDAVNIVASDLAIITTIDLDHQEYLGDTRDAIASEKAGIFKENALAVCGDFEIPLSVFETAELKNLRLYCLNHDYFYEIYENSWVWMSDAERYSQLAIPSLNIQDIAAALMAVQLLQKKLSVTAATIQQVMPELSLPGRFEQITTPLATIILDVAHNPHAVSYLVEQLEETAFAPEARTVAIFGMLKNKDAATVIEMMLPIIDEWYVTELPVERARSAAELSELIVAHGKNCYTFASVTEAMKTALATCQHPDRVVVFGSFYTVAQASEWLQELRSDEEQTLVTKRGFSVTPQMRHRIVGLLVLLGLVALFLPLLFSNKEPMDNVTSLSREVPKAPPMPEVKMQLIGPKMNQTSNAQPLDAAPTEAQSSAESENQAPVANTDTNSMLAPTGTTAPVATPLPGTATATFPNELTPPAAEVKPAAPSAASKTMPATSAITPIPAAEMAKIVAAQAPVISTKALSSAPQAWTIQVASYANSSTAQLLVQRLRAQGFQAYTREATINNNKRMTRVYVGPEISQAKLEQIQGQLTRQFKLSGVVLKYTVN